MKRIKYACLEQTIHFRLKEDIVHDEAVRLVREEVKNYGVFQKPLAGDDKGSRRQPAAASSYATYPRS